MYLKITYLILLHVPRSYNEALLFLLRMSSYIPSILEFTILNSPRMTPGIPESCSKMKSQG